MSKEWKQFRDLSSGSHYQFVAWAYLDYSRVQPEYLYVVKSMKSKYYYIKIFSYKTSYERDKRAIQSPFKTLEAAQLTLLLLDSAQKG
jgi:hypothetical protein